MSLVSHSELPSLSSYFLLRDKQRLCNVSYPQFLGTKSYFDHLYVSLLWQLVSQNHIVATPLVGKYKDVNLCMLS